jgi:hypothetical protein
MTIKVIIEVRKKGICLLLELKKSMVSSTDPAQIISTVRKWKTNG